MTTLQNSRRINTPEAAVELPQVPPSNSMGAARLGLWILGVGLGGFLLWAGLAPLDEGVPAHGTVTIDTKSRAVQHLSGGIVKTVLVREGEVVAENQLLLELDENVARANYESVRQRYLGLRAVQGRLQAEQTGQTGIVFHGDLQAALSDPLMASQMKTQQDLLLARRASLAADLSAIEQGIRGQKAMIETYQSILQSRRQQLSLLQEEMAQTRPLVADGYVPRNRLLELERALADNQAALADLSGQIARSRQTIAELEQRKLARQQEYRKEVETSMADVTREVQSDAQKMPAVTADLSRTQIRSPAAGQVVGLAVQSAGAVVQPGQKLMMLVPTDEPLVLEVRIETHLIDKVKPGLLTDVRFSSFAHSPQLVVEGEITSVSNDVLVDTTASAAGVPYYLARIRITPNGMKTLDGRHMQPGMGAEVIIKTGERSMLTYLLKPLTKRMAASLKEE